MRNFIGLGLLLALIFTSTAADKSKKRTKKVKKTSKTESTSNAAKNPLAGARSPSEEGLYREADNEELPKLTSQVKIDKGLFYYGTAMGTPDGKVMPQILSDGAAPRVRTFLTDFEIDIHTVTNEQFKAFVEETNYKTDAELYGWSFVLEGLTSQEVVDEVDGEKGYGRVQNSRHWMAVKGANWRHPYGKDSNIKDLMDYPAVHISYRDAEEYCSWAGGDPQIEIAREKEKGIWIDDKDENGKVDPTKARAYYRLPTEREWEMAARAGLINNTYPWGNDAPSNEKPNMPMFNHWPGKKFNPKSKKQIKSNIAFDGFHGVAPAKHYIPNHYGLYQMLGNVWEWALGGTIEKRPLRGGSFIDSIEGHFNHAIMVSTRQTNTGDSSAVNTGFRCAKGNPVNIAISERDEQIALELRIEQDNEIKRRQLEEENQKASNEGAVRAKEGKRSRDKSSTLAAAKEPDEGSMSKAERLARRRSSKKEERERKEKLKADIKRARRDTTEISMEL